MTSPREHTTPGPRDVERRTLLRRLVALLTLPISAPRPLAATQARPLAAFDAETVSDTLHALYGDRTIAASGKVRIGVAKLAENGAVVPVKVEVDLPGVEEIVLIATRNPVPLIARFAFGPRTRPFVATRVKLAETSEILAVVRAGEELLMARAAVEVTVGGCG